MMRIARAATGREAVRAAVWAAAVLLLLCVIHPQMLFVLALLTLAYLALVRPTPSRWLWSALPFAICAGPVIYYLRVLTSDPVVVQWSRQWKHQAPGIISLLLALGIPLVLTLIAIVRGWWRERPELTLMGVWAIFVIALLYIPNPVNIQRRLLDGIYLPVAVLAGLAAERLTSTLKPGRARRRRFLLVVASAVSSALVLGISLKWGMTREPQIFRPTADFEAMSWLADHREGGPPPAVLSDPDTGLYIPARSGYRVFAGHYSETIDYSTRAARARQAIRAGGGELLAFMHDQGLTYLFFGPTERALHGPDPAALNSLVAVYDRDGVILLRLT
jgi:hypothetical protein